MRILSTLLFMLCISGALIAQEKKHEITLFGDSLFQGKRLVYERPILQTPFFLLDDSRFETKRIEFFKNNHGRFANLTQLSGGKERYALKIKSGKIDLYEEIDMAIYGADVLDVEIDPGTSTSPLLATGEALEFYVKQGNPIQKAKYKNLSRDLFDNEESMKHLKLFKRYRGLQIGVLGLGLATTVGSLFLNQNNRAEFSPLTALGVVITGSAYLFEYPKRDELLNSVDAYNAD